jgi:YHS domain-containing protein
MFRRLALPLALIISLAPAAHAGEQFVDATGFAVSGYDVVSYFSLPQSDLGAPQQSPQAGNAGITADYNGATFAFATAENRDLFVADPAKYAPQYDGHCAYGVAKGGKVPGNPTLWRIVDGKLYLNITRNVVGFWEEDVPGNITLAQGNWPGLDPAPASAAKIPDFTSAAPVAN